MDTLAQITSTILGGSLPQLSYTDLKAAGRYVPEFELDATEDYCFDTGDAESLKSCVGAGSLTLAGAAPTYGAGFATIPAGTNGLKLNTVDQSVFTMAAVIKKPATPASLVQPLIGVEDPTPNTGVGIQLNASGNTILRARPGGANTPVTTTDIVAGTWVFIALTVNATANNLYVGDGTQTFRSASSVYQHTLTAHPLSLSKSWSLGPNYLEADLSVQRAIAYSGRALTATELLGLYARCKIVAMRRGIVVL